MLKSVTYFLFSQGQYAEKSCIFLVFPRADAARQALDKAREEEYNKRVGLCGVRIDEI